jgi:hypothetical protein
VFRTIRLFVVASLTTALISLSCGDAFAGAPDTLPTADQPQAVALSNGKIWSSALALVPRESRGVLKQTVASTNESKLLLGSLAGAAIVGGVALAAYGATSACKGAHGNSACDRTTVLGTLGLSGGAVTLVLWSLSK